jgi:hypothetical protein
MPKAQMTTINASEGASDLNWNDGRSPDRATNKLFIWTILFVAAIRDLRADEGAHRSVRRL